MPLPLKVVALAGLLVATPALGCYLENFDYVGFDVDRLEGKVYSARACQIQCLGNSQCYFWTYQPSTLSCYMKSQEADGKQTAAEGLISGPKACPNPLECAQENLDLLGGDIIDMEVINAVACQYQCRTVNGCSFWTFVPTASRCYLKGADVTPTPSEGLISGPRSCNDDGSLNCEVATDYYGHDIQRMEGNIHDASTCQKLCAGFTGCFYWTFVESTSSCYLKDANAPSGRQPNTLAISGSSNCTMASNLNTSTTTTTTTAAPSACFEYNTDYPGTDLNAFGRGPVENAEACQLLCQTTPECHYFTFFENMCYLKEQRAPAFSTSKQGAVSGPKYCGSTPTSTTTILPPASCFNFNVDYLGTDISVAGQGPVADHYTCQQMCQSNSACKYFTFFDGMCYLKSEMASQSATRLESAISGPKFCVEESNPTETTTSAPTPTRTTTTPTAGISTTSSTTTAPTSTSTTANTTAATTATNSAMESTTFSTASTGTTTTPSVTSESRVRQPPGTVLDSILHFLHPGPR